MSKGISHPPLPWAQSSLCLKSTSESGLRPCCYKCQSPPDSHHKGWRGAGALAVCQVEKDPGPRGEPWSPGLGRTCSLTGAQSSMSQCLQEPGRNRGEPLTAREKAGSQTSSVSTAFSVSTCPEPLRPLTLHTPAALHHCSPSKGHQGHGGVGGPGEHEEKNHQQHNLSHFPLILQPLPLSGQLTAALTGSERLESPGKGAESDPLGLGWVPESWPV